MKTSIHMFAALALVSTLAGGCSQEPAPQAASTHAASTQPAATQAVSDTAPQTALGRIAAEAIGKAEAELATENINLNGTFSFGKQHNVVARVGRKDETDTRPDAQLTPEGDLLIDGKPVPVTPAQHAMLVQYRQAIMKVAKSGMALGVQGADLGGQAIGEVFAGLMSGNPDRIEKNINAKAGKIEARARQLCLDLRPLQQLQQQLAAALPAFAPYATMDAADIEDCDKDSAKAPPPLDSPMPPATPPPPVPKA